MPTEEITLEQYRVLTAKTAKRTKRGTDLPTPAQRRCDGSQVGDWTHGLNDRLTRGGWIGASFRGDMWVCAWRTGERTGYYATMGELLKELGL